MKLTNEQISKTNNILEKLYTPVDIHQLNEKVNNIVHLFPTPCAEEFKDYLRIRLKQYSIYVLDNIIINIIEDGLVHRPSIPEIETMAKAIISKKRNEIIDKVKVELLNDLNPKILKKYTIGEVHLLSVSSMGYYDSDVFKVNRAEFEQQYRSIANSIKKIDADKLIECNKKIIVRV